MPVCFEVCALYVHMWLYSRGRFNWSCIECCPALYSSLNSLNFNNTTRYVVAERKAPIMNCFGGPKRKNLVIPEPDYKEIMKTTHFNRAELENLLSRYEDFADTSSGKIDKLTFLAIPEIRLCPLLSVIYDKEAGRNGGDMMEFVEFVSTITILSKGAPVEAKYKCRIGFSNLKHDLVMILFMCCLGDFLDLFDLFHSPDHPYMTLQDYVGMLTEITSASRVAPVVIQNMANTLWPQISKDGKLFLKDFSTEISLLELHSFMTFW